MKVSLDWIRDFLKLEPPFEKIAERLTMAGLEVKKVHSIRDPKDLLFEVEVTTNRPDWLSHFGVAREIAAVENLSLKSPHVESTKGGSAAPGWTIKLQETDGCPYYTGILIEGITVQDTPEFIKKRLAACGLRSVGLIVDITNYVLLETGQPLHAFDADLLRGKEIRVRQAKPKEKFVAIDGREIELEPQDLVIADKEVPVALAGVMGGKDTEVSDKTRNIFLESAFFNPRHVRQTSRRHGMVSDSSYRFERRVDPEGVDLGRDRALTLIQKYAKPRFVSRVLRAGEKPDPVRKSILLSAEEIEKRLGMAIKPHQVSSILTRLGLQVTPTSAKAWKVKVPSFRPDLMRPVDLVEEVARIYGYDNIPESLPALQPLEVRDSPLRKMEETARDFFSSIGLFETVTFSLVSTQGLDEKDLKKAVSIINPQNKELCWMRPALFPSLLEVIRRNRHLGNEDVFLFEIANIYRKAENAKQTEEEKVAALAMSGKWKPKTWLDAERPVSFYDLKGVLSAFLEKTGIFDIRFAAYEHPHVKDGKAEAIKAGSEILGWFGEISRPLQQTWELEEPAFVAELALEKLAKQARPVRLVQDVPRFPPVRRDISVLVKEDVKAREISDFIAGLGEKLIRRVEVFDLFRKGRIPPGHKSLGFRITYQSESQTLLSAEIQDLHKRIADKIAQRFQASFQ